MISNKLKFSFLYKPNTAFDLPNTSSNKVVNAVNVKIMGGGGGVRTNCFHDNKNGSTRNRARLLL